MKNNQEKYLKQWEMLQKSFKILDNKIKLLFSVFAIKISLFSVLFAVLKKQPFPKEGLIVAIVFALLAFLLLTIIINPWIWGKKNNHYINLHYFGKEIKTDIFVLQKFLKTGKKLFFIRKCFFCFASSFVFLAFLSLVISVLIILI